MEVPPDRTAQPAEPRPVSPSRAEAWTQWDDLPPLVPQRRGLLREARGAYGSYDDPVPRRNAVFQITLGLLLGLTLALVLYISLADAWGPFVTAPALVVGLPLVFARRNVLRHLGFGLLVSVPAGALVSLAASFILNSLV